MARWMAVPPWSDDEVDRVLIEATDALQRDVIQQILTRHGYSVRSCGGPEATETRCPLTAGKGCPVVEGADVVVQAMRLSDPRNREVLLEIQRLHPEISLLVEVPSPSADRAPEDFEHCQIMAQPMTSATLLASVSDAVTS